MTATTAKKGRPTINKESKTETHYSFRKSDNTPEFNRKANRRREIAKIGKASRRRNR